MTHAEFTRAIAAIQNERFSAEITSPVEFGLKRAEFLEAKLKKLVAVADKTNFKTARRLQARWLRDIARAQLTQKRLRQIQIEQSTQL